MKSILLHVIFIIVFFTVDFYVLSQDDSLCRPKIGLVFGGGGAKGMAHIGVLKVLEEVGICPDFIGGTSMGAIVAGLYAIGYPADSIEKLAKTIPWPYYLGDKIPRRDITIEEKEDMDRFILAFPLKEKKIHIPTGIINGQNIENMLNRLCSPVSEIRDFSRFNIPFLCIATDIENGAEVVLKEGYLPRALRASMSIPSYFSPVEIDNRLLVDGGLVNNFPAQRVKEMGADIVIGVDLGYYGYSKDELNSMIRIIQHSLFLTAEKMNAKNREVCDILITPELMKYNSSSFSEADTIIKGGEIAARKHISRLRQLADSISRMKASDITVRNIPVPDTFQFDEIVLEGLEKVSPGLVFGKLQLSVLQKVTPADLEKAISRVYSSLYFDIVTYEIKHTANGTKLIVTLKETIGGLLRIGIHYDSYNKSAILLNTIFRNILLGGSKLSVSAALGDNPYFRAGVFKNNGWKPGFGLNFESNVHQMFLYRDSKKYSELNFSDIKVQLFSQSIFRNSYSLGAGIEFENSLIKPIIDPGPEVSGSREQFLNYYGFLNADSYDNAFYPSYGIRLRSDLKLVTSGKESGSIVYLAGYFSGVLNITDRINIIGHIGGGAVNGDTIPPQYMLYAGGMAENIMNGYIPFTGLDYLEVADRNIFVAGTDLQLKFLKNIYLLLRANAGNHSHYFDNLYTFSNIKVGYGITLGYDSLIGPIEITLSKSGHQNNLHSFTRIGFYF